MLTITPLQDVGVEVLPPDIVWNGIVGDFAVSRTPADGPLGGLVGRNPIQTAVLMLLFSDTRVEPEALTFSHGGDRRGWVGDGFDLDTVAGEAALGSRLWLFRRSLVVESTARDIEVEVHRALQPLLVQRVVARIDARATAKPAQNMITLSVELYGRDGQVAYAARFDPLWKRADGL